MTSPLEVECCLLFGRRWVLLSRDREAPLERLVADAAGTVLSFSTEVAARAYARDRGEPVSEKPPQEVDLDVIARWCERCEAVPLAPKVLYGAWDFMGRTGALDERPVDTHGDLDVINSKLGTKIMLMERPAAPGWMTEPELDGSELRHLASLLMQGTAALGRRLAVSGAR